MAYSEFSQNIVFNGLGTCRIGIPYAGEFYIEGKISLPTIIGGAGASQCLVTINQNGSPIYVGLAGAEGFYKNFLGAVADNIDVVLSSSAAPDLVMNAIKTSISIGNGD